MLRARVRGGEGGGGSHRDPSLLEGIAPAKGEGKVVAGAQGHYGHCWVRLQVQGMDGLQHPGHCPIPSCCQDLQIAATASANFCF